MLTNFPIGNLGGAVTGANSFPLSLRTADQFTVLVQPGEKWYAGAIGAGAQYTLSVIERSIVLRK